MSEGEIHMSLPSIDTVRYTKKESTLQVRLQDGRIYHYRGVPEKAYRGLMECTDHLRYLRHIASKFAVTEIHAEGAAETERVRIQNFRSILDMTVKLDGLTILIGTNGTGKTTVLEALGLFGPGESRMTYDDIGRGLEQTNITLSFRVPGSGVPGKFLSNGMIELRRTFTTGSPDKPSTKVAVMHNRDFDEIRNAANDAERSREIARIQEKYPDFPAHVNTEGWDSILADYEHRLSLDSKHRSKYSKKFISFSREEIDLSKILEVVVVPTARDIVADASEEEGSNLSRLMDLAVRSSEERVRELWKTVMTTDEAGVNAQQFGNMIRDLNRRLKRNSERYMTGAEFSVGLVLPGRKPDVLKASVSMKDDEFMEDMVRAGSGAQRVYLFSLLDTMADLTKEARERDPGQARASPVRLYVIDEPELYQHPQRQKRILRSLAEMAGEPATRIICGTHSSYFVEPKRADSLRILRRGKKRIFSATREQLVGAMLSGSRSVEDGWREVSRWLDLSAPRWAAEGFFAGLVVIVEGDGDRNILLATAYVLGLDLDRQEITIVPAEGADNIARLVHLFRAFGIPTYVVWDGDKNERRKRNQKVAAAATGHALEAALDKTTINENFAYIEGNMTDTLAAELRNCAGILKGSSKYAELERARARDEAANGKSPKCRKRGGKDAPKKIAGKAQKKFLHDRLKMIELLGAVGEADHERLKSFTITRIVFALQAVGAW